MCLVQCPEGAEEDQHHVPDHLLYLFHPGVLLLLCQLLILLHPRGSETIQPGAAAVCQPPEGSVINLERIISLDGLHIVDQP